ncbi:MAG: GyrI-like domain-containing protein [Paracoccaceae bacterium]
MQETRLAFKPIIGAIALCLPLAMSAVSQERLEGDEAEALAVAIKNPLPVSISAAATRPTKAVFEAEAIHKQIRVAMRSYVNQRLDYELEGFYPKPVLFLFERPKGEQIGELAVGLAVRPGAEFKLDGPLQEVSFSAEKAVRHVHIGPHKELEAVYDRIAEQMKAQGMEPGWPVVLQILNNPLDTPPEQLKTVMNIPVR